MRGIAKGQTILVWVIPEVEQLIKEELGKGPMWSALMGSLQMSCLLTEGRFGYFR